MSYPLHYKDLVEIAGMIRQGDLRSQDITQQLLDRISTLDGHFKCYIHVCTDRAIARAQEADAETAKGMSRGPLHGVPIAVKDLCYTTFAPSCAGTTIHADFLPSFNATVVDRLEAAGAIILGKLKMTEGAYTGHHPSIPAPLNPWNPDYWVGTSSSGSGVAPSAGLCFAALGSDTGGSIRYPCATCGLTGLKPTYGRVSRHGIFPLADSLDHIGPMARSAVDCAAILQVMAGWDANDPTSLDEPIPDYLAELGKPMRDMRIGFDRSFSLSGADPEVAKAMKAALSVFKSLGARIIDVTLPPYEELVENWIRMCAIETAVAHQDTYPSRAAEYGPALAQLIDEGHTTTGTQAAHGHHLRIAFTQAFETMMGSIDCMLCPTMLAPTPSLAEMTEYGADPSVLQAIMRFTAPFDFSGSPTITLPNGFDTAGMPLSMQLVGPKLGEAAILRAAHTYQNATDWHRRMPDIDKT